MKIILLCRDDDMINAWKQQFNDCSDVEIIKDDFVYFIKDHDVDVVVSPANSFGLMDGGYDAAITEVFGNELQKKAQGRIISRWYGEQPVGTALTVKIPNTDKLLIHVPTMRTPEVIEDICTIYQCMRVTLIEVKRLINKELLKNDCTVVIPAFGAATGMINCEAVAQMMFEAYKQVNNPPEELDWIYADMVRNRLSRIIKERKHKFDMEYKEYKEELFIDMASDVD